MAITWDEYFMGIAVLSSKRSKDPRTKTGACIVNADKLIVGVGYNGAPRGWNDAVFPWNADKDGAGHRAIDGEVLNQKYPYVIHAELNAILNAHSRDLRGCTLYATLFPCNECTKAIAQSGIKRIIYLSDQYAEVDSTKAAKKICDALGIRYEKFKGEVYIRD